MKALKPILITLAFFIIGNSILIAQGINYKAIIRDEGGAAIANRVVNLKFTILEGDDLLSVYEEEHAPTTNANGIVIVNIGEGTVSSGDFSSIAWATDTLYLKTEINTGNGLVDMGTTQFKAVPFALASLKSNDSYWEKNGDDITNSNSGKIGFDVPEPKTNFHFAADERFLIGTDTMGAGDKLMFLPDLHAFRVGTVATGAASTYWDRDSIGLYSFASGLNTRAQGFGATAMGRDTEATNSYAFASGFFTNADGQYSTAMGFNCDAFALGSTALGYSTDAEANYSFAAGYFAEAQAIYSVAIGNAVRAQSYSSIALGRYNVGGGSAESWNPNDPVFELGIGTGPSSRENAITVKKNGNVGFNTSYPIVKLHITGGTDAGLSTGSGYIQLGNAGGLNLVLDENEIIARSAGVGATLYLQNDGGNVSVGGSVVHTSDRRLKKDISPIHYGLKEILSLNPVAFYWINREQDNKSLGLIAQEVEPVIHEIVHQSNTENDMLSVDYTEIIPVLIKAMQEQQAIIDNQANQIRRLNDELENLNEIDLRLKNLEALTNTTQK